MLDWLADIQVLRPWALWMALLPLLALVLPAARGREAGLFLPQFADLASRQRRTLNPAPGLLLALLAWLFLVVAAAQPRQLGEPVTLPKAGRDMLLAVDLSGSMEVRDMRLGRRSANRLQALQVVADRFIEQRRGDRLGLILFGSEAFLQTPLTFDIDTVRTHLQESSIGLPGRSTAIGDAIALAVRFFRDAEQDTEKVLVLLTDGQNNAGSFSVDDALELAETDGVVVYTIGFGSDIANASGQVINPELLIDETALRRVAERTGGQYFRAERTEELVAIYDRLNQLEPVEREDDVVRPWVEQYRWPLLAGLLLAAMAAWRYRQGGGS